MQVVVRRMRALTTFAPTRRFAVALACVAPLWLVSANPVGAWIAAGAVLALAALCVSDVAALPRRRDLDVRRDFPETVGVGDQAEGRYVVESRWNASLHARLYHTLPPRHLSDSAPLSAMAIPPRGRVETRFHASGAARGDAALGDVALRVGTRLGLVARTIRYEMHDRVLVAPSLAGVKRFRWLAIHHRLATVGIRTTRRRGEGRSFSRLRDYVVGDDPRYIDWKATARRGHPITREFTVEQSQTVFVLVDAGRSMTQLSGRHPRFEYALSATLLLADVAITAGDRVGALVFDDQLRALVPAQRGATALQAIRTALVPVQPTLVEPDYASAFRALAQRQRKRSLIVLVTDVIDARAARSLLAHLTKGASRHLAVVVALRNEALLATAAAGGTRVSDLYTSAAAEELISERLTALQRMRDAGVVVLDVAPDAMAAAVVNQYLELKSRGAL
ncbi:MAG: DUF58 domain-containing protein [Gemmatimonadota bacterium]